MEELQKIEERLKLSISKHEETLSVCKKYKSYPEISKEEEILQLLNFILKGE